jgi:hypothetical protein
MWSSKKKGREGEKERKRDKEGERDRQTETERQRERAGGGERVNHKIENENKKIGIRCLHM